MEDFKEYSVAEFFKKNKHMLGFSGKVKSLTTIVHELVTNSLDATEQARILPDIKIEIYQIDENKYKVVVSDNGPGIPKEYLGKVFGKMLAGTKFHKFQQQRGQQGIGAAGVSLYAKLTTGMPLHVISGYNNKIYTADISIDFNKNEPIIENLTETDGDFHGVIVEGVFGDVKLDKSEYSVYEYVKRTALVNPHARFELITNEDKIVYNRQIDVLPPLPPEITPHILGVSIYDFLEMAKKTQARKLRSFLINEFDRVSEAKVQELEKITGIDFSKDPKEVSWQEAEIILKAVKQMKWMAPRKDVLSPIGEEGMKRAIMNIFKTSLVITRTRNPQLLNGGIPYVVDVGLAYGGDIQKPIIMRFANKVPLLFDSSACAITKAVTSIDWKRYEVDFETAPILVAINISSVYVPYVSTGKTAIASEDELIDEIRNAIMESARSIKTYIHKQYKAQQLEKKRQALIRYIEYLSNDLNYLSSVDKNIIKEKLEKMIKEKYSI
jgi:DNA topoisomerase-6 subunit B